MGRPAAQLNLAGSTGRSNKEDEVASASAWAIGLIGFIFLAVCLLLFALLVDQFRKNHRQAKTFVRSLKQERLSVLPCVPVLLKEAPGVADVETQFSEEAESGI